MPIRAEEVRRIAELARLELDDAAVETFRHQLETILDYVAMLDGLDVSRVEATASPLEHGGSLRRDEARRSEGADRALRNAPEAVEGHFRVPRVLPG